MIETINNKGTSYTIGGNNYYGQWILPLKSDYIFTGTLGANVSNTYDISTWLPNDGYDYDVQFSGYIRTGASSGNSANVDIENNTGKIKIDRQNTRSSSNHIGAGGGILRVPADNKIITVTNSGGATTGSCGIDINMIRRVGAQAELPNNYVDEVQTKNVLRNWYAWRDSEAHNRYTLNAAPQVGDTVYYNNSNKMIDWGMILTVGSNYIITQRNINGITQFNRSTSYDKNNSYSVIDSFGGSNFDGSFTWLSNESQSMFNGATFTMTADSYNTFSVPFLPNDGYDYEVLVSGSFNTGSASNNVVSANIYGGTINASSAQNLGFRLCRQVTRTASSEGCAGSAIVVIPANDRNITVWNPDGNAKSGSCYFYAHAYRRIGKNE